MKDVSTNFPVAKCDPLKSKGCFTLLLLYCQILFIKFMTRKDDANSRSLDPT